VTTSRAAVIAAGTAAPPAADLQHELERQATNSVGQQWFRLIWFASLLMAICFEGLGRKFVPSVPSTVFYFLKDGVLIIGLIRFRINREVKGVVRALYRRYVPFLKLAFLWTVAELLNPAHESLPLGLLGLRAYWFWWAAPFVVASVLLDPGVRRKVIFLQSAVALAVALFAFLQFGSPPDDVMNTYAIYDGKEVQAVEVTTTGRVRVSSTFTFISGFTDFAVLVPALLLSIGLGEANRKARMAALVATVMSAAALPMSGSRAPFVIALVLCGLVAWRAGLVFTSAGRRVILLGILAALAMVFVFPDAVRGVMDRFGDDDTGERFNWLYFTLPPVAIATVEYPFFGLGTGMQQNFRNLFHVYDGKYAAELEISRHLIELGVPGYLLIWITKFGIMIALWKASKILTKAGRRAAAGAALSYALLTFYGHLTFDHIYAALYFVGLGFILQEVVDAWPLVYGTTVTGRPVSRAALTTGGTRAA
jgi:hypothetical protein